MHGLIAFIKEQGVVGLAVGFLVGGAVSKVVTAFIADIINPVLSAIIGEELAAASVKIGAAEILYGDLLSVTIDFMVILLVVYLGVKVIGLHRLDKGK